MKHLKTWWLLLLGVMALPYLLLLAAGSVWLYQHGWLWYWLALGGAIVLAGWPLAKWLKARSIAPSAATVEPSVNWAPSADPVWQQVEAIARRVQDQDLPLNRLEPLWQVVREVLDVVARHYRPQSSQPVLDIPVPYVLRVIELVCKDLREAFSENVPAGHILTLHDFQRFKRLASVTRQLYIVYRLLYFGADPLGAVLREARDKVGGKLIDTSADEVKRWALGFFVRRAGYYAIELYSGHLVLSDVEFHPYQTRQGAADAEQARRREEKLADEPLRILVLGQVKAGKSSLINALFGETRAAVDVVPRTRFVEPYVLERDGMQRAIILDTAGYQHTADRGDPFEQSRQHVLSCDLVLVVCSALSAARDADRRLLDELRAFFQRDPDRILPPLIVALTHIDRLRPLAEWNPPYNIAHPDRPKARQIADAVRAVADDLLVAPETVVPLCLKSESRYNVEEGLVLAILQSLSEADRVKYLRCLRQFHDEEYWRRLWQQAVNSGRLLLKATAAASGRLP